MIVTALEVVGGTIAGAYSWASYLYAYNREAWMIDIQVLQQHDYQNDNIKANSPGTYQMSREQIRDRTEATITKIDNSIVTTTLIIMLTAEILIVGQIPSKCADFVLNVYMLSVGSAFLYLSLGILFGLAATNVVYEASEDLLTNKVPPPWQSIDEKMRERESKKMSNAFESLSLKKMFMPPLFRRLLFELDYGGEDSRPAKVLGVWGSADESEANQRQNGACRGPKDGEEDLHSIQQMYAITWFQQEKAWMPIFSLSRRFMVLGLQGLLQAYSYLCLSMLYGHYGAAWSFWLIQIIFTSLNIIVTQSMFDLGSPAFGFLLVAIGPFSCAVAAMTPYKRLDSVLVPICYSSHLVLHNLLNLKSVAGGFDGGPALEARGGPPEGGWGAAPLAGPLCPTRDFAEEEELNLEAPHLDRSAPSGLSQPRLRTAVSRQSLGSEESCSGNLPPNAYELRLREVRKTVSMMVTSGTFLMRALWVLAVLWSLCKSCSGGFSNSAALVVSQIQLPVADTAHLLNISWPSIFFRPRAMACWAHGNSRRFFIADEFRVFDLTLQEIVYGHGGAHGQGGAPLSHWPCQIENGTIADIARRCTGGPQDAKSYADCWPVVLLNRESKEDPRVYDCRENRIQKLLQTEETPSHISLSHNNLYAVIGGKVREYQWSPQRKGWVPRWVITTISNPEALVALDVTGSQLVLFHQLDKRSSDKGSTVEVIDLETGGMCGIWELPRNVAGAGCAYEDDHTYIITKSNSVEEPPHLFAVHWHLDVSSICYKAKTELPLLAGRARTRPVARPLGPLHH